jgi:hypothetical protein
MRLIHSILLVFFGSIAVMAQPVSASPEAQAATRMAAVTGTLTATEAQADFDRMRAALEEAHAGLYRYSAKAEMDRVFAAQRAKLSHSMTKKEFLSVASEAIAQIHCGHTDLRLDDETRAMMTNDRKFPLRMLIEGERLIVVFNDTPDDGQSAPAWKSRKSMGAR